MCKVAKFALEVASCDSNRLHAPSAIAHPPPKLGAIKTLWQVEPSAPSMIRLRATVALVAHINASKFAHQLLP